MNEISIDLYLRLSTQKILFIMKHFLFLITACLLQQAAMAQSSKTTSMPVTDVTVFMSGAQVTHSDMVTLKAGENLIRITDLTANLDPNSIQVEGNSNYLIVSVRHQLDYTIQPNSNPKAKQILDSLDDLRFKQKELSGLEVTALYNSMIRSTDPSLYLYLPFASNSVLDTIANNYAGKVFNLPIKKSTVEILSASKQIPSP